MSLKTTLITTKIPHHSQHSGYEQLIRFIPATKVAHFDRGPAKKWFFLIVERFLRRFSASKWYQWDGVLGDILAFKTLLKPNSVVHFLYGDTSIGLLPYIKNFLSGKLVLTIHACPSDMDEILQFPHMIYAADALILLGATQKKFFLDVGVSESKLHVIPHGVDLSFFKPISLKPNQTELQVLMVGNWRRNFDLYRNVIDLCKGQAIQFHIVTPDFNQHYFRGCTQVKMYSNISDESLRSMYQYSDVLLMGLTDAVANNVILEAAACGLPIISEKVGAVAEYLDENAVFFVEPNDAKQISEKLMGSILDRTHLQKKAEIAFNQVQKFDWNVIADKTKEIYLSLF